MSERDEMVVRFVRNPDWPPEPKLRGLKAKLASLTCEHRLCYDINRISDDGQRSYPVMRQCARCGKRGWPRP